jgi:hypothetical protein
MDSTKEQRHILYNSRKKCDGDPGNDLTSVRGRKHEPYTESPNSPRTKKARQVKSKIKSMLIIFFNIKGVSMLNRRLEYPGTLIVCTTLPWN